MHFATLQTGLFIFLIATATALFGWLIHDYMQPVFWTIVFAIVFYPLYRYFLRKTKERGSLSAVLTILSILVIVFVPLSILGSLIVNEALTLYGKLSAGSVPWQGFAVLLEYTGALVAPFGIDVAVIETRALEWLQALATHIGPELVNAGRATASTAIGIGITLYLLFFALRDGEHILERIIHALPLGDKKERLLVQKFSATVRAMFRGTFIIAIIQGALGGLLFALVGIPSAALWGFVMGILALIPAIGTALVWLPAGVALILTGSVWQGVIVLLVGAFVIGLIDNILRPVLVGKRAAMPDALVLLSVIGGLSLFGVTGIIIGPVITAFFLAMWQLFEYDYAEELETRG